VPEGLNRVVAIAAGSYHSLALKSDGTVVAWGWNVFGQSTVPGGLSNVVAIAAGGEHSLALKSDGTVAAWGSNATGESTVPAGLNGVVAIAAGGYRYDTMPGDYAAGHSLALVAATNQNMAPAIVYQASGNNILLSWPLSAPGFSLQSTTNLTAHNSWTILTNLPVIVDSQNRVTDRISGGAKFYRLH